MSEQTSAGIPRLKSLAEFRYHLRSFLSFSESAAERYGVAAQQYQLLQVIGAMEAGKRASISYLADRMILRHNSAVELVDRAERAGLVRRESDETDLRRSLVALTPHGHRVLEQMVVEHVAELEQQGDLLVKAIRGVMDSAGEVGDEESSEQTQVTDGATPAS